MDLQIQVPGLSYFSIEIEHILTACPAFDSERRAASLHGRSMSEVLGNDCSIGGLMLFLRNTGFIISFKPHYVITCI